MKYQNSLFDRNIGVWSEDFQDKLGQICIAVAGVGGAAHAAIDILVRNGIGRVKLADPDTFAIHNLQRQVLATQHDLDRNKAEVVRDHILSVNPQVRVDVFPEGLQEHNLTAFLQDVDFVIEALDISVLSHKRRLYQEARQRGIITLTSPILGCGAGLLVFFPDGVSFEEYFDFPSRHGLSVDRLISRIPEYFQSYFFARVQQGTVPTTCDGAYLTGVLTAGAIKRILAGKPVQGAPHLHHVDIFENSLYPLTHFNLGITPLYTWTEGVFLKLEGHLPTGSAKYRVAQKLLERPKLEGKIHPSQTVIEASSGNMGVALAMFAKKHGMSAEIYALPDIDPELRKKIQDYGGQVHIFQGNPMELMGILQHRVLHENCYWPNQYTNPEVTHSYRELADEISNQLHKAGQSRLDYFVAALGTGGSLMGVGPKLRQNFGAKLVCVESDPADPIHGIRNSEHQHMGDTDLFRRDIPDHIVRITQQEAQHYTNQLRIRGISATSSTGACLAALDTLRSTQQTALILSCDGKQSAQIP